MMGRIMGQLLLGFEEVTEKAAIRIRSFSRRAVVRRSSLHFARHRHVLGLEAGVGDDDLEGQNGAGGDESNDGKHVGDGFAGTFVVVILGLKGGSLGERGATGAKRLGRGLELNGGFRKGDRRARCRNSTWSGWSTRGTKRDRRSTRTHRRTRGAWGRRGTRNGRSAGSAERNGRSRCGRTRSATGGRSRSTEGSRRRTNDRSSTGDGGGRRSDNRSGWSGGRRSIGRLQGDADGFLFQGHARRLLGRSWLVFILAHAGRALGFRGTY